MIYSLLESSLEIVTFIYCESKEKMKISIITVSYNSVDTIRSTLDSIAAQIYPDLEYIIVDGGSTDGTLDLVDSYKGIVSQCISEHDQGIYDAMNKGINYASGDVIGILNSDDFYLHSEVLNEVVEFFSNDPSLEVILGDVDFVKNDDLSHPIRRYPAGNFRSWMLRFGIMPPHPAVFLRTSAYKRVGLYKLGYEIAADFDFLTRLLLVDGAKYQSAYKTWVRMRTGGASTRDFRSNLISSREMKCSMSENGLFSSYLMLMCRLPFKLLTQVLFK